MHFQREFELIKSAAVVAAMEAGSVSRELPAVAEWKSQLVDSRSWKCFTCGAPATKVEAVVHQPPSLPDETNVLIVACTPVCTRAGCSAEVASSFSFMKGSAMNDVLMSAKNAAKKGTVLILLWSDSGGVGSLLSTVDVWELGSTLQRLAIGPILISEAVDMRDTPGGANRDWHCVRCGAISCAFVLGFDVADPLDQSPAPINWIAGVFPHCDSPSCRAVASARAREVARDDPNGVVEGSLCVACSASSNDRGRGMQRCGRCKAARYRSAECQRKDWPRHKATCVPREGK